MQTPVIYFPSSNFMHMIAPFQWLRKSQKFLCIHNSGLGRLPSSSPFLIFFDDEDDCMAKVGCW